MSELVAAEFDSAAAVVAAAKKVRALGYAKVEAYTPFPLVELDVALKQPRPRIPKLAFGGGLAGFLGALAIQWWTNAYDYPIDVGGRPFASWPTYVIIIFEATVLGAAFTAFFAVLLGARMPRLHDPIFDLPGFERSTVDRFWLTVGGKADADLRAALAGAIAIHGAET